MLMIDLPVGFPLVSPEGDHGERAELVAGVLLGPLLEQRFGDIVPVLRAVAGERGKVEKREREGLGGWHEERGGCVHGERSECE